MTDRVVRSAVWACAVGMVAVLIYLAVYVVEGGELLKPCDTWTNSTYTGWQTYGGKHIRCLEGSVVEVRQR